VAEQPPPEDARTPRTFTHALTRYELRGNDVVAFQPMTPAGHDVTALLQARTAGDTDVRDRLMAVLYQELRSERRHDA
jgi:hypothetical protein